MTRNNYHGVSLRNRPDVYRTHAAAARGASYCIKPHYIVMGVAGEFLLVCPSDARRLVSAGFEMV